MASSRTALYHVGLVILLACFVQARQVYVDCSIAAAEGDGTRGKPYGTIDEVNQLLFYPGDSLTFKAGTTCVGALLPKGSGTKDAPILLTSYGDQGQLPIINGNGTSDAVSLINQDYYEISRIAVTNPSVEIAKRRGVVATADDGKVHYGISIHDVMVYDVAGQTNKATQSDDFVASAGIAVNGTGNNSRFDDVSVYSNTVRDCGGGGIKVRVGQENNRGLGTHVWGNDISQVGGDGIVVSFSDSPLIESNAGGYLGYGKYPYTGGNFAGMWVLGCLNAILRFNVVHTTIMSVADSEAFDCDYDNEGNCTIEYNYTYNNGGGFFLNCDGCDVPSAQRGPRQIVRYNIFHDCRMQNHGDTVTIEFYNNVVYCPDKAFDIQAAPNTNFTNNIFVGNSNYSSSLPNSTSINWASNLFYNVKKPAGSVAGIVADPKFVRPGVDGDTLGSANGYKLQKGSPAFRRGSVVPNGAERDFWGNIVSVYPRPNIGAYNGLGV